MLLKLNDPKLFSDAISIISELVTEVKARIDKQGLGIIAIDPANVALTILNLPSSTFSQFQVEKEEILGLNLDDIKSVLRRCPAGSSLVIEKQDNMLNFHIQDKSKRSFSLALINIEAEEKKVPELQFTSKVEINSTMFAEAIEDAVIVADSCTFSCSKNTFVIEAKGSLNKTKTEFTSDECKIQTQEEVISRYSLEYLQKFIKACKISDKAIMQFGKDYPLRLDFQIAGRKEGKQAELAFILAPRVETEE